MNYAALILAAGSSSRMGQPKQMLDINGEKLLVRTARATLEAGLKNVMVVIGHEEEGHRKILAGLPLEKIYNPSWKKGMGSSLKRGLAHLLSNHPSVDAVIILVCDQPMLSGDVILSLIRQYEQTRKPIVASRYSNMPGVPVLFDQTYFRKLSMIADDEGAKKIILQHPSDVVTVDFPGGDIDLDTMEDYHAFRAKSKK